MFGDRHRPGIPEMRRRGYSPGFAAGIIAAGGTLGILLPPSITMILYAVAAEQSLGRLFLAGIGPGLLLTVLFSVYAVWRYRSRARSGVHWRSGDTTHRDPRKSRPSRCASGMTALPRVLPFLVLLTGVMVALYGGFATPGETAGLGAILALVARHRRSTGAWRLSDLAAGPVGVAARIHDAFDDRGHVAALLHDDELSAYLAERGGMDRGDAFSAVGSCCSRC